MAIFQTRYYTLPNGSTVYFSDTIPSSLGSGIQANVGDYCMIASNTTSGADAMWVCVTAGAPGTWIVCARGIQEIMFGPLSATSTSGAMVLTGGVWRVASIRAVASVKAGASATVTVEYLSGTTAPGSGTAQLTTPMVIDTTYTANTVLTGTMITTPTLMVGGTGRLGVVLAGTLTGLANLYVTVALQKLS